MYSIMYSIVVFISLLLFNLLAGFVLTGYQWQNVGYSSFVLLCNFLFVLAIQNSRLKDAFKVSLSFVLPLIGVIEFVLAVMAAPVLSDNISLMVVAFLLVFQFLVFLFLNMVSQKID